LFSQFVSLESSIREKISLALIAGGVDMLWYLFVVAIISRSGSIYRFQNANDWLNRCFGLILAFIAVGFIVEIVQAW
jgi:threonine/homoserine/homoserine lactone efflux protein